MLGVPDQIFATVTQYAFLAALGDLQDRLDAQPRDWARYTRQAAEFHLKSARAWASAAAGEDLAGKIDPDFSLGAHALACGCRKLCHVMRVGAENPVT